jgi:hypothetical protein
MRDNQIRDGATTTNPRHALDPERGDAVDPDRAEPTGADETPADWPPDMKRTDGPGEPPAGQVDRDETDVDTTDRDATDRDTTGDEFGRGPTDRDTTGDEFGRGPTDRDTTGGDFGRDATDQGLTDRDTTDRDTTGDEFGRGPTDRDTTDQDLTERDTTNRDDADEPAIGVAEAPPGAIPDERPSDSVSPGPLDQPVDGSTPPSGTATDTAEASTAEDETARPHDHDDLDADSVFADDQANGFRDRWREVQASFVDDPTTAVRSADELIGEVVGALNAALQERQRTLGEGWRDASDVATEEMRATLVRYRAVFQRIIDL